MEVTVYGPLRSATGEKTVEFEFDGDTVGDALAAFVERYPRARPQLYGDDGRLRGSVRVGIDGERAEPEDSCPPDATLALHPAVQGGGR
ncbi:MAG: ubiquitin-like small modifier protein 1 [Salinigranum sp.]